MQTGRPSSRGLLLAALVGAAAAGCGLDTTRVGNFIGTPATCTRDCQNVGTCQ